MLLLFALALLYSLLEFGDQVTGMRHILSVLVFVPFRQAEVFIVPGDELGLASLKEQRIGEEYFTS